MPDILIIEDETALLDALSDGLGHAFSNMEVRGANSAEDALPLIMQGHPLLIISDIKLPGKSGIDFLIETRKRWPGIKFILMSAFAVLSREQALARGAFRLIRKPFPLKELVNSVREAFADKSFKGSVEGINLIDLMQLIHLGHKTTSIFIAKAGEIYFEKGEVVHARAGELEGIQAFFELMHLGGGHFSTRSEVEAEKHTITEGFEHILLEAVKIMDEESFDDLQLEDLQLEEVDIEPLPQPRFVAESPARTPRAARARVTPRVEPEANEPMSTIRARSRQGKLDEMCKSFAQDLDGVMALAVVDLSSGLLMAAYCSNHHFNLERLETTAAAMVEMTQGKTINLIEKLLGNGSNTVEELFFSTNEIYHFSKVIREKNCQLVMVTRKAFNQGMGWATLRTAVDEFRSLLP